MGRNEEPEILEYQLFHYRFTFYKTYSGEYRLGSLTQCNLVNVDHNSFVRELTQYRVVLAFIEETLNELNDTYS